MLRFRQFLLEGYTLPLAKWESKFGNDFSDSVKAILNNINGLTDTFNLEETIKGKILPVIKGKITGVEVNELFDIISVPKGWTKEHRSNDHIWIISDEVKIVIQWGTGSSGSDTGSEAGGDVVPSQSDAYEMGFCVVMNYLKKNSTGTLEKLNALDLSDLTKYLKDSDIVEIDKYWKSRIILNTIGWSSVPILKTEFGDGKLLKHSGKLSTKPVSSWTNLPNGVKGGTDGTWKADIYFDGGAGISIKDESGGQLASGLLGETLSSLYMANEDYKIFHPKSTKMAELADSIREQVAEYMSSGPLKIKKNITRTEAPVIEYIIQKFAQGDRIDASWALENYGTKQKKSNRNDPTEFKWDDNSIKAFAGAITKMISTGRPNGTKWQKGVGLSDARTYADTIEQEYVEISREGLAKDVLSDIQKVINQKRLHSQINESGKELFNSQEWKQYLVFETATGYRKWVDATDSQIKNVSSGIGIIAQKEVAGYILEFNKKSLSTAGVLKAIDQDFCWKKAKTVSVNASFKTSSTSSPALRVQHYTPFQRECEIIVEEEVKKMEMEFLAEGRIGSTLKNLGRKIQTTISNIMKRIYSFIDGIFQKGFNFVLETFGFQIATASISGL